MTFLGCQIGKSVECQIGTPPGRQMVTSSGWWNRIFKGRSGDFRGPIFCPYILGTNIWWLGDILKKKKQKNKYLFFSNCLRKVSKTTSSPISYTLKKQTVFEGVTYDEIWFHADPLCCFFFQNYLTPLSWTL